MWDETMIKMILEGIRDTLYMTLFSTFWGYLLGLPGNCADCHRQ